MIHKRSPYKDITPDQRDRRKKAALDKADRRRHGNHKTYKHYRREPSG